LNEFILKREEFCSSIEQEKIPDHGENIVIISAQPGMGKSTMLENMAIQDIRRAKALAVVLETASIVDSEGTIVDLSALDEDINRAAGPQITEIPAPDEA
jgi:hypothetical protein